MSEQCEKHNLPLTCSECSNEKEFREFQEKNPPGSYGYKDLLERRDMQREMSQFSKDIKEMRSIADSTQGLRKVWPRTEVRDWLLLLSSEAATLDEFAENFGIQIEKINST